jgi:hypothetical protein
MTGALNPVRFLVGMLVGSIGLAGCRGAKRPCRFRSSNTKPRHLARDVSHP